MPKSEGPKKGTLLIIGGAITPEIAQAAIDLSRGSDARWIVIPTAQGGPLGSTDPSFTAMTNQRSTARHTYDRDTANSEEFIAPIKTANAVWFSGGRQYRFVDAYAGTRTEQEIREVLNRGGLIAGTSAGATIQGSYLFRGAPSKDYTILMSPGHEDAFGYISNTAIDQHVTQRGRQRDLWQLVSLCPHLLGIGLDEGAAVVVRQNIMEVIGKNRVLITDGADHGGKPFYPLAPGDHYDLAKWVKL